ncbi:ExbD/TolR family protein [Shewanella baltica]|uniref:ExbD/TolR family protein n=1 Tax=Shewanella baltica TaxID=62322 RepID=UPI003D029805
MHFPERRPDQTEERILPLINVVFLLLIFFMVAGSLSVTAPFDVTPPVSQSDGVDEPDAVLILISRENKLALDNEPITEAELLARIDMLLSAEPETQVTLKVDGELSGNQLVHFTQALYGVGVKKLRLLTEQGAK